jgi:hypothetical protein
VMHGCRKALLPTCNCEQHGALVLVTCTQQLLQHIHSSVVLQRPQRQAKDGVCDDGRFLFNMTRSLPSTVLCDLGTDCSDCGPWKGAQHSSAWCVGSIHFALQQSVPQLLHVRLGHANL